MEVKQIRAGYHKRRDRMQCACDKDEIQSKQKSPKANITQKNITQKKTIK